jgi:hypothetical protein
MSQGRPNLDDPLRTLDRYEVALRGLLPAQVHAELVVRSAQVHHPELATDLLRQMSSCGAEHLIDALLRLKAAMEGRRPS